MAKKQTGKSSKKQGKAKSTVAVEKKNYLPLFIILGVTFLAFANAISNGFVNWDDPVNLYENPNLERINMENLIRIFNPETGTILGNYNPLPIFTFFLEKAFFGLNPKVFHFNNILLHLVCVFFVYKILDKMCMPFWGVVFATLMFGIHPMRVESVAWITERKDVLFAAFYFAAIYTWIKAQLHKEESRKWKTWTLVLFVLSLFSKIQAVSLPLSLLALDYWMNREISFKLITEKIPHFALSLVFGLAGVYFLGQESSLEDATDYTFLERLLVGAYSYCVYIAKWVFPYQMSPLYPYKADLPVGAYIAPLGVLAVLGAGVWAWMKNEKALVFGLAFFTFNIMFLLQVLGAGQGLMADRFSYVAYFGLFFIGGWYLSKLIHFKPAQQTIFLGLAGVYSLVFIFMTYQQNKIWENGGTLWSHAMECSPEAYTPYQNLGKYYQSIGQVEQAKSLLVKSIELSREKDIPYNSRGKIFFDQGQLDSALFHFNKAVEFGTSISEIYVNRGATYARIGNLDAALPDFNKALELDANNGQAYLMRSLFYFTRKEYALASKDHLAYLKIDPYDADVWYEEGLTQKLLGKPTEALQYLNKAIELDPGAGLFYAERARVHQLLGQPDKARSDQLRADQLK
ncbi:MAG: tetratricopeptide repeat protein [Saprospiraceae bacterium]|nr:tetratricopeptide repeat protein [Saprospiraceae bacterium]